MGEAGLPMGSGSSELLVGHLESILASDAFAGAWRQRRLLQFLVERCVQGRTDDLKEYSVGVEVFEKGVDFDPRLNPIVRVEVSRLRKRLQQYYENQGNADRIRIELPRGSYIPKIHEMGTEEPVIPVPVSVEVPAPAEVTAIPKAATSWRARLVVLAASCAVVLAALGIGRRLPVSHGAIDPVAYSFSRITTEQSRCSSPTLSPDGKFLAYVRRDSADSDIFLRPLAGGEARNLTPGSKSDDSQPAYSPDGERIAFRSERDGGGIFLISASGGDARRVADFGYHPSWAADGRQVVFSSKTFDNPEDGPRHRGGVLFTASLETGTARRMTGEQVYDAVQPAWSPHGHRIAFWGSDDHGNRDLWTIAAGAANPDNIRPVAVTNDPWIDWNPQWSPDGRFLYFVSDRDGAMNLWRVAIDEVSGVVEGAPQPIRTPSSYSAEIALSRDGKRIVYVNRQISSKVNVQALDLGGGAQHPAPTAITRPGERFREPDMSPDGGWLTVRIQDPQEDIGLMRPDGSGLRRLTNDRFKDRLPLWSPDGSFLYFLSNRAGTFEYWAISPDGSGLRRLSPSMRMVKWRDGALIGFPSASAPVVMAPAGRSFAAAPIPEGLVPEAWSPDGRHVVGRAPVSPNQPAVPVVYSLDDRSSWSFAESSVCPTWLADSSRFLFRREGQIRLASLRERSSRPVLSFPAGVLHDRFTLSRDQKSIFFVLTEVADSIWMAERR